MKTQLKYHEVHPLKAHKSVGVGEFTGVHYTHFKEKPLLLFLGTISQQMRISKPQVVHLKNMQFLCQLYPNIADKKGQMLTFFSPTFFQHGGSSEANCQAGPQVLDVGVLQLDL